LKPQKLLNRPRFCYESGWVQSSSVPIAYTEHITLGGVYSDMTALGGSVHEVMNYDKLNTVLSLSLSI